MTYTSSSPRNTGKKRWILILILLVLPIVALAIFRIGPSPTLELTTDRPGIGPRTAIDVRASEPVRGLSGLKLTLIQGEREEVLIEETLVPRPFWAFWGDRTTEFTQTVEVGSETLPDLESGTATLRWTAQRATTWLRSPAPQSQELELPVQLTPPTLEVASGPVRIDQGGTAVVAYRVGEASVEDGVEINGHVFPGRPLPGGKSRQRFTLFAAPHDLENGEDFRLFTVDALGNRRAIPFVDAYRQRAMTQDTIQLSEGFMREVVNEIYAQTPQLKETSDLLSDYLQLNRDLRRANSQQLAALSQESVSEFLWQGAFDQLPNSRVMAPFADRRTYRFNEQAVDQQDHLGFDLASVRQAPVPAANSGRVVLAEFFGIYGNTVVVDHGFGLMSLYSHLSRLSVEVGQDVARGDVLGRTGKTGLAGGDHLHFTMLVWGMQVSPLEWWDGRWIEKRITDPLAEVTQQD